MSAVAPLYPWQHGVWRALSRDFSTLAHAVLLTGQVGLGKERFAAHLAQSLLCQNPQADALACGQCQSCRLYAAGSHPDLHRIHPLEAGKAIIIDQVRALGDFLYLRPHIAARKIVLLAPAQAMNINAANGLLKMLEEPPAASHFILVSSQPTKLSATVRSRCSAVALRAPPRAEALAWLQAQPDAPPQAELLLELAGGAPLAALALGQNNFIAQRAQWMDDIEALVGRGADPVGCAARWKTAGAERGLGWLQGWVSDLIKIALDPSPPQLFNPDARTRLQALQNRLHLKRLFGFFECVSESRNLLGGPLDELLLLEDVLIQWTRLPRS